MLRHLALTLALRFARASLDDAEASAPRPDEPPRVHAAGRAGSHLLVVGNGAALGLGVRTQELALAGAAARAVSLLTGFGVDVDLVAKPRLSALRIPDAVRSSHPGRYVSIIVVTGGDEALGRLPLPAWRRRLTAVLAELRAMVGPETAIVVTGVPATYHARPIASWAARLADAHALELDRVSAEVCAGLPKVRFVALTPPDSVKGSGSRAADEYAHWGVLVAVALTADPSVPAETDAGVEIDEDQRQAAVDLLGLTDAGDDPRLRRIVHMARRAFGTETALFTVLDHDIQLHVARSGTDLRQIPRSDSFCRFTILDHGGMIVGDAENDDRFRHNPLVTGEPHIRFYAGFPVDSPDGERVGALCVYDSSPRRVEDVDTPFLRELAHLVQRELWRYLPSTASSDSRLRLLTRSWTFPLPGPQASTPRIEADPA